MKNLIPLLLAPTLCLAGPGPATEAFMNQSATLFDLGMLRLDVWASQYGPHFTGAFRSASKTSPLSASTYVVYDKADDMIYVGAWMMDEDATDQQMEAGCRDALDVMRLNTGKVLSRFFAHYGEEHDFEAQPKMRDLFDKVELRCSVTGRDSADGRFYARQPLSGRIGENDGIVIGKWKMSND